MDENDGNSTNTDENIPAPTAIATAADENIPI
jgi:hypothetical protein